MATLTTANSVFMLQVAGFLPAPIPIQGYAADDAFMVEDVESAETYMGVDGNLSGGFVPYIKPLEFSLQADSLSCLIMDTWIQAEALAREKFIASATILIQGTGTLYTFQRGFLKKISVMPSAKKVLQPRKYTIDFNHMSSVPT